MLGEIPTDGIDVDAVFQNPRVHLAKTLETQ